MKNKAIWIDKEKAHILTVIGESVDMHTVVSPFKAMENEDFDRQGGATEVLKDRKTLEREKLMTKQFFQEITSGLNDAIRIFIMGPAQMGQHFHNYLKQEKADLGKRVVEVAKSEQMTENQLKATVRDFYLSNS